MTSPPRKPGDVRAEAETTRDEGEAFLRRWSRRKHQARVPQEVVGAGQRREPAVEVPSSPAPERILTDADMPPIESLNESSDFSIFNSPGVSEDLRRRALRKLFLLPTINQRCPLDGEWYDCHGYEPLGNIITHEMREEMAREAEKLKQAAMNALQDGDKKTTAFPNSAEPVVPEEAQVAELRAAAVLPATDPAQPVVQPECGATPVEKETT